MSHNMHAHIEVKKNGTWHHYGAPNIKKDYTLFALIAGEGLEHLRNKDEIKPVAKIKGMPSDISLVTQISYEQSGGHNISVLTAEDLWTLQDRLYELNPWIARTGYDELDLEVSIFHHYINGNAIAQHQGYDDVRVICWFSC